MGCYIIAAATLVCELLPMSNECVVCMCEFQRGFLRKRVRQSLVYRKSVGSCYEAVVVVTLHMAFIAYNSGFPVSR